MDKGRLSTVDQVLEVAIAEGADPRTLRSIRGTEAWETLPHEVIRERNIAFLREFDRANIKPGFMLRAAQRLSIDRSGVIGLAMKTAKTLAAAWQRRVQYHTLWSGRRQMALHELSDGFQVFYVPPGPVEPWLARTMEYNLAAMVQVSREGCGQRVCPRAVYFRHTTPRPGRAEEEFFGTTPVMGHAWDGIEFDAEAAALPMVQADEGLSRFLLSFIESLDKPSPAVAGDDAISMAKAAPRGEEELREQVCRHIGDQLTNGVPTMTEVARALGMSARTLRRRLAEIGLTFEAAVAETRNTRAELLLRRTTVSITEIAFLTGFSQTSAFHRAFKRATGMTPREFRSQGARIHLINRREAPEASEVSRGLHEDFEGARPTTRGGAAG